MNAADILSRVRDIVISVAGLCFLLPLMLLIAAMILLFDGRPVLFFQRRSGLASRVFFVAKFRTMNAVRAANGALLSDEQRITRTGQWLRAFRVDELPQLWNVLAGDMSIVGPRPLLPETIAQAGSAGQLRGTKRPGLTGWAQVNGNTLLSAADKLALDNWYIANRSFALDLRIMARTLLVVLQGERIDPQAIRRAHACGDHRGG